jgi:hypothetical protein
MGLSQQQIAWQQQAAVELLASRSADGGWPYRAADASSTEPTAMALLAMAAIQGPADLSLSYDRLLSRQREDGFWSASDVHAEPSWTTPLAGLAAATGGAGDAAERAAGAMLAEPVYTFTPTLLTAGLYNYDPSIPGWPWTFGDFGFVEPTALAVIFLKRQGHGDAPRVREAVDMLRARSLPGGLWNYGEPKVLGGELFPTIAPTALALIALADEQDDTTQGALSWLADQQGQISSLFSLGWAATALNLHGRLSDAWPEEVVQRWNATPEPRRCPLDTSLCLLGLAASQTHPLRVG